MNDLFDAGPKNTPLAALLRPESLDEIIGQEHITGPGKLLRRRVEANQIGSILLYGPPGTGKTTTARAVGKMLGKRFVALHGARNKVKDVRDILPAAKDHPTLLFLDEVHRFSATQADELLDICEDGAMDFIGATTENPFHAVPKALVSRSTIMKIEPISMEDMERIIQRGLSHFEGQGLTVCFAPGMMEMLAGRAGGDARRALTAVENLCLGRSGSFEVTREDIEEVFQGSAVNFDRQGDMHYDITSAMIKAIRGSDPDGALYWLARLIHGGEDPRFIARRLIVHASEDIGLADNTALQTAVCAAQAVEFVGLPEARINLSHAVLHLARAPKSNSAYRAINLAMSHVETQRPLDVPLYLRDGHYAGAKALGHQGYKFPHDDPRGWVEQDYIPGIPRGTFYQSDARTEGTFEKRADMLEEKTKGRGAPRKFPG